MKTILIIEDDENLRNELANFLENNGYNTIMLTNFDNPIDNIKALTFDLILLDFKLPNYNGGYILKEIRKDSEVPIIMLTSVNDEINELISLSNGADDYVNKPFNTQILLLRMEKHLKNTKKAGNILTYKDLTLNIDKSEINNHEKSIELSKNENIILSYLLKNYGKIVSRDEIMDYLWGTKEFIDDNTLTVNVSRIKNKLHQLGYDDVITTKRGQGYLIK